MKHGINTLFGLAALLSLLATPLPGLADGMTMGEAINQAGRQRMLTQRIVKAYAMAGQQVDVEAAAEQLQGAVALFEKQLAALKGFAPNDQVRKDLAEVSERWARYKLVATAAVDRERAMELRGLADKTLAAAHAAVLSLQAVSGTNAGRLVNIAGRQRMLSQRLASLYLLKAWGFQDEVLNADYATAIEEFSVALKELQDASENTDEINQGLKQVRSHWHLYKRSGQLREGEYIPLLIVRSSEKILTMMNRITGEYAAVADRLGN